MSTSLSRMTTDIRYILDLRVSHAYSDMNYRESSRKRGVRKADDDAERAALIARGLKQLVKDHAINGILAELPHGGAKGARALRTMGLATGVVVAVVELRELPCEWYDPQSVKLVAGKKNASKLDVERAVLKRWPQAQLPSAKGQREHCADAIAVFMAAEEANLIRALSS